MVFGSVDAVLGAGLKLGKLNGADLGAVALSSGLEIDAASDTVGRAKLGLSASLLAGASFLAGVVVYDGLGTERCVGAKENGDFEGTSVTGAADDGTGFLLSDGKLVNAGVGAAVPFVEAVFDRKLNAPGCAVC